MPACPSRIVSHRRAVTACAAPAPSETRPALQSVARTLRGALAKGRWAPHLSRALEHYNAAETRLHEARQGKTLSTREGQQAYLRVRDELRMVGTVLERCKNGSFGDVPGEGFSALLDTVEMARQLRRQELAHETPPMAAATDSRTGILQWADELFEALSDGRLKADEVAWVNTARGYLDEVMKAETPGATHDDDFSACLSDFGQHLDDLPSSLKGTGWQNLASTLRTYVAYRAREIDAVTAELADD